MNLPCDVGRDRDDKVFVLVIGGGQAGLAVGYYLKTLAVPFVIVERNARIGDSWRNRYRSLTLFTPRRFSELPGFPHDGDPEGYAGRDEFADYLERYSHKFELPIRLSTGVAVLRESSQGGFDATLSTGEVMHLSHVVIATGGFQVPTAPPLSNGFDSGVPQLSADTYKGPSDLANPPRDRVLVVGDGASGRDIANELAAAGRKVILATGKHRKLFPERILGKSTWWWLQSLGLMKVSANSIIGRLMKKVDPFPDRDRNLKSLSRKGVRIAPRLQAAAGQIATFSDGASSELDAVIWTIGYADDTAWIQIPGAVDRRGQFAHSEGVSPIEGLFFVGRPWQRNRASGLIMGVGPDAKAIVGRITQSLR